MTSNTASHSGRKTSTERKRTKMDASDSNTSKPRHIGTLLRVGLSVALLTAISLSIDFGAAIQLFAGANLMIVAAAFVIAMAIYALNGYRWRQLIAATNSPMTFFQCVRIIYVSAFIGLFLPGTIGVEAVRMYAMAKATSARAQSFTSVALDRFLTFFVQFTLLFLAILIAPDYVPSQLHIPALLALAAMLCLPIVISSQRLRNFGLARLEARWLEPVKRIVGKLLASIDEYRGQPGVLAWAVVLALVMHLTRAVFFWTVATALGFSVSITAFIIILPIINLVSMLPISLAGLGTRELAFVILLAPFAVSAEGAYAISLLGFFLNAALPAVIGGFIYARSGLAGPRPPAAHSSSKDIAEQVTPRSADG